MWFLGSPFSRRSVYFDGCMLITTRQQFTHAREPRHGRRRQGRAGEYKMASKGQLLQDPFLNVLRKEHIPVSIYLVNGIKLQGQVEAFDQYVVLLRNTVTQMVYKHAISTVVPTRSVNISTTGTILPD